MSRGGAPKETADSAELLSRDGAELHEMLCETDIKEQRFCYCLSVEDVLTVFSSCYLPLHMISVGNSSKEVVSETTIQCTARPTGLDPHAEELKG